VSGTHQSLPDGVVRARQVGGKMGR